MDELNYQQARRIRGETIGSLFADQLIAGKGYKEGFKNVLTLKSKATAKGIKEKFDVLNIAKTLTGGSRLGPAIAGKIFGRSKKDIEYFAGRAMPIFDKITKLSQLEAVEEEKDGEKGTKSTRGKKDNLTGVKTVLNKILTFLNKSFDREIQLREKENNFKETYKLQDEKRHNQLLKVLAGISGGGSGNVSMETTNVKKHSLRDFKNKFKNVFKKKTQDVVVTQGEKALTRQVINAGGQEVVQKSITKIAGEKIAQSISKAAASPFNIVGVGFAAAEAAHRVMEKDWEGVAYSLAKGTALTIPYFSAAAGPAAPVVAGASYAAYGVVEVADIARQVYKEVFGHNPSQDTEQEREQNYKLIMSIIGPMLQSKLGPPKEWGPEKGLPPPEMIGQEINKTQAEISKTKLEINKKGSKITNFESKQMYGDIEQKEKYLQRLKEAKTSNPSTQSATPMGENKSTVPDNTKKPEEMSAPQVKPEDLPAPKPVKDDKKSVSSLNSSIVTASSASSVSDTNTQFLNKQNEFNELQISRLTVPSVVVKPENTIMAKNAPSNYQPTDLGEIPVRINNNNINGSIKNQTVVV
jgi:hypothetical protein